MKMIAYSVLVIMQDDIPEKAVKDQLHVAIEAGFVHKTEPSPTEYMQYAQECHIMINDAERMGIWKRSKDIFGNSGVKLTSQGVQCLKADQS